jgi:hypothetical protein
MVKPEINRSGGFNMVPVSSKRILATTTLNPGWGFSSMFCVV